MGCTRGASPMMLTVAAVASFTVPSPGLIEPTPKVSTDVSDVPHTTGVPARNPQAAAAVGRDVADHRRCRDDRRQCARDRN